jgi:hypothetical protein
MVDYSFYSASLRFLFFIRVFIMESNINSFGTVLICPICGASYQNQKKGRTKDYCSDNYRDVNKFLSAFETRLLKVGFKGSYSNSMKSRLFLLANNLHCVSKKKG